MEAGPPGSPCRRGAPTTASCAGLEAGGGAVGGKGRCQRGRGAGHGGGRAGSSGEGPVMGRERGSRAAQGKPGANPPGEEPRERSGPRVKSSVIDKRLIMQAWEKVRANNGAPGVDAVGIGVF